VSPRELQSAIANNAEATRRVLAYLDSLGVQHSGRISGSTLAAVCGVDSRTWRKWAGEEREMPEMAVRLLRLVAGLDRLPK
jgi:hypothetical protein